MATFISKLYPVNLDNFEGIDLRKFEKIGNCVWVLICVRCAMIKLVLVLYIFSLIFKRRELCGNMTDQIYKLHVEAG